LAETSVRASEWLTDARLGEVQMEDIFSRWKTTHVSFDVTKEMGLQCFHITAKATSLIE